MDTKFVNVCGVPTKILTWGKKVGEKFDRKEIILFITGNPGLSGFYITFLATLFNCLQGNIPVWIIGHAGHDEPENETDKIPRLKHNKHLYNLDGQINHKVEFIRNHIPADVKIHLVGHSIGGYISLKLLKFEDLSKRIHHCYLLFPTIEYMADTPNGRLYTSTVQKYFKIFYYLSVFVSYWPCIVRKAIVSIAFWIRSIPFDFMSTVLMYIRPSVISKVAHMADSEMLEVYEPDYDLIEKNKHCLTFLYSTTDEWTPITYYERLVERIPDIKAQVSDKFDHAFVLKSSKTMGELLAEWIQKNLS